MKNEINSIPNNADELSDALEIEVEVKKFDTAIGAGQLRQFGRLAIFGITTQSSTSSWLKNHLVCGPKKDKKNGGNK